MADDGREIEVTEEQKKKISLYLRDQSALRRAVGGSLTSRRQGPQARLLNKGNRKAVMKAIWERFQSQGLREEVHRVICEKLDWCNAKNNSVYDLVVSCVKLLLPIFNVKAGALANIVFLVQEYMFDKLCDCSTPKKGAPA